MGGEALLLPVYRLSVLLIEKPMLRKRSAPATGWSHVNLLVGESQKSPGDPAYVDLTH
jgi:hypothetical protein